MASARRPVRARLREAAAFMDVVAAYFERFNARELDGMADLFGPGYTYAEPLFPEPRDAAGHVALMQQIAASYPDRQMRVRRRVPGASGEAVEALWSGTRAGSGITMPLDCLFAVDIDPDSGRISRMRGYYEPPA
jgi:SnoaL-like domain